jgi:hypothetical protein
MRVRRIVIAGLALLVVALIAGDIVAERIEQQRTDQIFAHYARLEQDMRQHLPVGTSYPQIAAYLQQKGIGYSYYPERREILILFEDVVKGLIVSTSIQVVITLDDQQRLQNIEFRQFGTGP